MFFCFGFFFCFLVGGSYTVGSNSVSKCLGRPSELLLPARRHIHIGWDPLVATSLVLNGEGIDVGMEEDFPTLEQQLLDDLFATTSWIVVVDNSPLGVIMNTCSLNGGRLDLELGMVIMVMKPLKTPTKAAKKSHQAKPMDWKEYE